MVLGAVDGDAPTRARIGAAHLLGGTPRSQRVAQIEFRAKVWAPMEGKGWTFVTMPKSASAKLGAKGRVPVAGTINGHAFRTSAFPDGEGSHQIQINNAMKQGAGVGPGDVASFVIERATDAVAVDVPNDLAAAVDANPGASAQWAAITPKAREEWVGWVTGAKKEETRAARIARTIEKLAGGAKRPKE